MELQRREGWERILPIPGIILEIKTCISCPDSEGFDLENDGDLTIYKPVCGWNPKRKVLLVHFPVIPHWCPKTALSPDMSTSIGDPERFCAKRQAWQNLSSEAKMVLNVIFTLPEEFLGKNKVIIRSLISRIIKDERGRKERFKSSKEIYRELKNFTWEISH